MSQPKLAHGSCNRARAENFCNRAHGLLHANPHHHPSRRDFQAARRCDLHTILRRCAPAFVSLLGWILCSNAVAASEAYQKLNFSEDAGITDEPVVRKQRAHVESVVTPSEFYPKTLAKKDVFLVGQHVVIDKTLMSYGGDVLILADQLEISAPIDTRVRATIDTPFWEATYKYQGGPIFAEDRMDMHHLLRPGRSGVEIAQAFFDWMYWHDDFDEACRCYKFSGLDATKYNWQKHEGSNQLAENSFAGTLAPTSLPILPYGAYRQGDPREKGTDGTNAPEKYDLSEFRSGSIRIYARTITFCDECRRTHYEGSMSPLGDERDIERTRFLVTSGLRGGRGGVGGIAWCVPYPPTPGAAFQSACEDMWNIEGGNSGEPSRGADGGNIEVHIIGNDQQLQQERKAAKYFATCTTATCDVIPAELQQSIAALADTSGGGPATLSIVHTPSFNVLRRDVKAKGRKVFTVVRAASNAAKALAGVDGQLSLDSSDIERATADVVARLANADSDPRYDRQSLIACLATNGNIVTPVRASNEAGDGQCDDASPGMTDPLARSLLTNLLDQLLVARQQVLLRSLRYYLLDRTNTGSVSDLFVAHRCDQREALGINEVETLLLRRLCEIRPLGGRGIVESFFYYTGGLFRTSVVESVPSIQLERLISINVSATELLLGINNELKKNRSLLHERITEQRNTEYQIALVELQARLGETLAKLGADNAGFGDAFKDLEASSANAKSAYAAYLAGNYISAATNGYDAFRHAADFFGQLGDQSSDRFAQLHALAMKYYNEIAALKTEIREFSLAAEKYQRLITIENSRLLEDYLGRERLIATATRNIRTDFPNLVRAAVRAYFADPFKSSGDLQANLAGLEELVSKYPYHSLETRPSITISPCSESDFKPLDQFDSAEFVDCALLSATQGPYIMFATNNAFRGLPLVVVDGSPEPAVFPVSMHRMVQRKDIQRRGEVVSPWIRAREPK